ncbi:WbqC family protein [Ancylomarina longa]|uniref:WbqC family protein n=1 Tax=Ancylomarina longa TaxID=2487017 RepID=A0A434ATV4_9BACT|nr:WbqC family protein [Ancylomarina longa]RUT77854.1 hypothetical protein DLK05_10975 [Ancylomarina longa]
MEDLKGILSTAYFAPIQYYCKLIQFPETLIEQWEHYPKQSYRNRCNIYGANGVIALSVPVVKATNKKVLLRDVKISYDTNWQKLHWKGIEAAYKSSPFYEFYIDDLAQFFHQKWNSLLEFNLAIQDEICSLIELDSNYKLTNDFIEINIQNSNDFRYSIHPKTSKTEEDTFFIPREYTQVFSEKLGFEGNLSILDLIFNLGPDSSSYLQSCISKL